MNHTVILGNITRDIELKHTQGGKSVCQFTVAHNSKFKAGDGTMKEDVIYLDCEAWNQTAETIAKYLGKGRKILAEGFLKQDNWTDKTDGSKRSKIKLKVERFYFVDSAKSVGGEPHPAVGSTADAVRKPHPPRHTPPGDVGGYEPIQEDDIPFSPQHHFA